MFLRHFSLLGTLEPPPHQAGSGFISQSTLGLRDGGGNGVTSDGVGKQKTEEKSQKGVD